MTVSKTSCPPPRTRTCAGVLYADAFEFALVVAEKVAGLAARQEIGEDDVCGRMVGIEAFGDARRLENGCGVHPVDHATHELAQCSHRCCGEGAKMLYCSHEMG